MSGVALTEYEAIQAVYRKAIQDAQKEALEGLLLCRPDSLSYMESPFLEPDALKREMSKLTSESRQKWAQWCSEGLQYLEHKIGRSVVNTLNDIRVARDDITCHQCGVCCRLASSEYTYDELCQQAEGGSGDVFAEQFTRVFLPYANTESAREKFPQILDAMEKEVGRSTGEQRGRLNFYYCPYVGEDNRCTLYGSDKRPALCETYPENPLVFVQSACSWNGWKHENHQSTLQAHARLAVAQTYAGRLEQVLQLLHSGS